MKPQPLLLLAGKAREEGVQELQEFGSSGAGYSTDLGNSQFLAMESDDFQTLEQSKEAVPFRLFFSINPPPDVIHHLSAMQSEVRKVLETGFHPRRTVRWIRPTQFHLTILFLGNVSPAEIPSVPRPDGVEYTCLSNFSPDIGADGP